VFAVGFTTALPLVVFTPVQPPLAVQVGTGLAALILHPNVTLPPLATEAGLAVSVTTGAVGVAAGGGGGVAGVGVGAGSGVGATSPTGVVSPPNVSSDGSGLVNTTPQTKSTLIERLVMMSVMPTNFFNHI
jgi:hypothetical protein